MPNDNFFSENEHAWTQLGRVVRSIVGDQKLRPKTPVQPSTPTTRLPKPNPNERWNGSDEDWANKINDNG